MIVPRRAKGNPEGTNFPLGVSPTYRESDNALGIHLQMDASGLAGIVVNDEVDHVLGDRSPAHIIGAMWMIVPLVTHVPISG
jgi:hypothetical protein